MGHTLYENLILENKIKDMLDTKLDAQQFMIIDRTLAETIGRKKQVAVYDATGSVRDVAQGEGNEDSDGIQVSRTYNEYEVKYTQGFVPYFDEEVEKDSMLMDTAMVKQAAAMANDLTAKFYTEIAKATRTVEYPVAGINFNTVVDAIKEFGEDDLNLFMLINPEQLAQLRKNLKDELKYVEAFARSGYIGTVCGVPVQTSNAVPSDTAYIATKEAVTCFVKKDISSENTREANIRKNTIYFRRENVVALTDNTKIVKLVKATA